MGERKSAGPAGSHALGRADGGSGSVARRVVWPRHQLFAQGLHPAHETLPRRLPLLHLRGEPARRAQRLPLARGGAGDRPRGGRGGLHRGAVHPGRQARAALAPGAGRAGGAGARDDHFLPDRHVCIGAEGNRPAAARQPRRDEPRRDRRPACRHRQPGDHAGKRERAALRTRPGAPRQPGQAPGGAAGGAAPGRRAAGALHHRHPDRHRRDAGGTDRGAAGDRRHPRAARPYPGSHHPEFPRQATHQAGGGGGARPRRPALDHRRGAAGAGRGDAHPGAAQPLARRLPAAGGGGAGRLGRRLPGDARPRQPGSALAASGRPRRANRRGRQGAGAAAADLCRIRPRARYLVRPRGRHRDAPRQRRRRLRPRR